MYVHIKWIENCLHEQCTCMYMCTTINMRSVLQPSLMAMLNPVCFSIDIVATNCDKIKALRQENALRKSCMLRTVAYSTLTVVHDKRGQLPLFYN